MAEKKDYLNSLAEEIDKKPESFREEKVEKIEKKSIPLSAIAIILAVLLIIALAVWFFFFRAKIDVPNFVGKNTSEISVWVKQNGLSTNDNVIVTQQYSLDYDEGVIISQSVSEGSKFKKNGVISLVVSQGADPDELISFPDIKNMEYSEINEWIKKNKLTKTKVTTEYSDSVPADEVISYELKNVSENNFTRSTTLNIKVSKGEAPAQTVTLEDFEKSKTLTYVQNWAKSKKVEVTYTEEYSETIEEGYIISQSVPANKTIKEGESFSVVVSKGIAITMPYLIGSTEDVVALKLRGLSNVVVRHKYSATAKEDTVMSQSIASGTVVTDNDIITITYSLGYILLSDDGVNLYPGAKLSDVQNQLDRINGNGADILAAAWDGEEYSDVYAEGEIIRYACAINGREETCDRPLEPGTRISCVVSKGPQNTTVEPEVAEYVTITGDDYNTIKLSESGASNFFGAAGATVEFNYETAGDPAGSIYKVEITHNGSTETVKLGTKVYPGDTVVVYVYNVE